MENKKLTSASGAPVADNHNVAERPDAFTRRMVS